MWIWIFVLKGRIHFDLNHFETSLNQHRRMNEFFNEKQDYITLIQLSDIDCGCDASRFDAAIWADRVLHCECVCLYFEMWNELQVLF